MSDVEIVVIGSCNVDLITYTPRFPYPGETIHGNKYEKGLGGKGANQCVAAAKLGARTAMVGKVGLDADGDDFLRQFCSLGINTKLISQTKNTATGIATILVNDEGNNAIVIVPGANLELQPKDAISAGELVKSAEIVVCQNEIPLDVTLEALRTAKFFNKFTIFNPAPAPLQPLDEEFYLLSDIICCNESETYALTNIEINSVADAKKAALQLCKIGCKLPILTLGENGCVYVEKNCANDLPVHVMPSQINALDTTGAGDAFVGALAFFLIRFPLLSLHEKISRACRVASLSVLKKGTQSSYPDAKDLPSALLTNSNAF